MKKHDFKLPNMEGKKGSPWTIMIVAPGGHSKPEKEHEMMGEDGDGMDMESKQEDMMESDGMAHGKECPMCGSKMK